MQDSPAGPNLRNCSGMQRGSAQVTAEELAGRRRGSAGARLTDGGGWWCQSCG